MSAAEYARVIRPRLPAGAFAPRRGQLVGVACHLLLIAAGHAVIRQTASVGVWAACALLMGHSLACLAFVAHDVSHKAVVRQPTVRRGLELLLWGVNLVPPTLWNRIHTRAHHAETNTLRDPDRPFRASEASAATIAYMRLFFPNRRTPLRHPGVLFHFVTYIVRHVLSALIPGAYKPTIVTYKPSYTLGQRLAIAREIVVIAALQVAIWQLHGGSLGRYVWASGAPLLVASAVVMLYVFTNHFLNPLHESSDPLGASTSVVVPRWMDLVHDNFSFHTEHHLFPAMNPRYFPVVSRLLREHFPERYHRLPLAEAWRRLWLKDQFIDEGVAPGGGLRQRSSS